MPEDKVESPIEEVAEPEEEVAEIEEVAEPEEEPEEEVAEIEEVAEPAPQKKKVSPSLYSGFNDHEKTVLNSLMESDPLAAYDAIAKRRYDIENEKRVRMSEQIRNQFDGSEDLLREIQPEIERVCSMVTDEQKDLPDTPRLAALQAIMMRANNNTEDPVGELKRLLGVKSVSPPVTKKAVQKRNPVNSAVSPTTNISQNRPKSKNPLSDKIGFDDDDLAILKLHRSR